MFLFFLLIFKYKRLIIIIIIKLEICSLERGICPIAMLYSLAAAYKGVGANRVQLSFMGGRVVVNFVLKFVAMATGVSRG